MKKILILFLFLTFSCSSVNAYKNREYYIKKDNDFNIEFLCFSPKKCYNSTPYVITINGKKFVGFGGYHYFDISTYRHDIKTDTYTVNVIVDRDPSNDLGYYSKCPYDKGYITHLIFKLIYNPTQKIFKSEYIGFVSSEDIIEYEGNTIEKMYKKYINTYYDNDPNKIAELQNWLDYFNKKIIKTFGKKYGSDYDIEIIYILKRYLFSMS